MVYINDNFNQNTDKSEQKSLARRLAFFAFLAVILFSGFMFFKVGRTFSLVGGSFWDKNAYNEKERIDILILGKRGAEDEAHGGNLTDTMMILSIKTDQNKVALISIPRDLYVQIPHHNGREKINYAYAFGEGKGLGGIKLSKEVLENITGISIDYAVVVDFNAFEKIIDAVGGVDVHLEKDFVETSQWGWEFRIPAGKNTLDGKKALYYVRSRFSTNDFDRARRQQEVIVALKNKILSIGVLTNPIKLNEILNSIGSGIETDINLTTGIGLVKYLKYMDKDHMTKKVFDLSENGLIQSGMINNAYVLYPKAGLDNYADIRKDIRTIFEVPSK